MSVGRRSIVLSRLLSFTLFMFMVVVPMVAFDQDDEEILGNKADDVTGHVQHWEAVARGLQDFANALNATHSFYE